MRLYPGWRPAEQRQQNRRIMRGEIPDDIDVATEEAEIETLDFNTIDIAKFAVLNQLAQFLDRGAVLEGMPNHQNQILSALPAQSALPPRRHKQSAAFRRAHVCHGAAPSCAKCKVGGYRGGDHDSIDIRVEDILDPSVILIQGRSSFAFFSASGFRSATISSEACGSDSRLRASFGPQYPKPISPKRNCCIIKAPSSSTHSATIAEIRHRAAAMSPELFCVINGSVLESTRRPGRRIPAESVRRSAPRT